jgi:hypothetical protein
MKRFFTCAIIFVFSLTFLTEAKAWFWDKKTEKKEAPAVSAPKEPAAKATGEAGKAVKPSETTAKPAEKKPDEKAIEEARKAKRALIDKKRKEIDNMQWEVDMVLVSGKGKKETDTITFKEGQVSSANFSKKGFKPTNYSVNVQADNTVVWETMQNSEKNGVAFWRGEMNENMDTMRGIISHRIDDKKKDDYSLLSVSKKPVAAAQAEAGK